MMSGRLAGCAAWGREDWRLAKPRGTACGPSRHHPIL